MENGAIRNFESLRLAEKQAEQEAKQKKEEEENNPMKILENRTRDSRREMAILETLEDLRELNTAHANVDTTTLLKTEEELKRQQLELEKEEDEEEIRRIFGRKNATSSKIEEIVEEVFDTPKSLKHKNSEQTVRFVCLIHQFDLNSFINVLNLKFKESNQAKKPKNDDLDLFSSINNKSASDVPFNSISKALHTLTKPQPSSTSATQPTSLASKLAKSGTSIVVRKKNETEVKKEPEQSKTSANVAAPAVNPLGCLAAYGSDDSNEEDN
jgi:hypothetical protein